MDKYTSILTIPEIDNTTVNEARKLFFAYKDKNIISDCTFDNDVWNLNNETQGFHFNFKIDEFKFEQFGKMLNINAQEFKNYLKTFIICQMGALELGSLRTIIYTIKKIIYNNDRNIESLIASGNFNWLNHISDFFSMLPKENREKELETWLNIFDDIEDFINTGKYGNQRSLASFESYFRFDDIIKRFWTESQNEDEKLFFFPIWMWWNVSGILPLRPCEFVVTPRQCLTKTNGKYTLAIRRTKIKGASKRKSYKINSDYEINQFIIPDKLAHEIEWYIEKTKDLPEASTHTLFVTNTHYAMWERVAPYTSRYFSYVNLRTCLRYFFSLIVQDRYGYRIIYNNQSKTLPDEQCIEYIHLGDTRHLALINLIAEGATPMVAMILAGHDNPEISSHYYSNISQLIECRTYRQYKKQINGKQTYSLSKHENKLSVKVSINLEHGGRCTSQKFAKGDFTDCYKIMGPSGEIGLCNNCPFYYDDNKTFSDSRNILIHKIENECILLEEIVKRVRSGKGEQEEIIPALLRLRDHEYTYQQYLLEKMEEEHAEKKNV